MSTAEANPALPTQDEVATLLRAYPAVLAMVRTTSGTTLEDERRRTFTTVGASSPAISKFNFRPCRYK
jgi:hypothetical protein